MLVRIDPQTHQPIVTILKSKDLDTWLSPDSKHVHYAELEGAITNLRQVAIEFELLAGFKSGEGLTG
jgi:hypothetical protein